MGAVDPHNYETFYDRGAVPVPVPPGLHAAGRLEHWEVAAFRGRCLKSLDVVLSEREAFVEEMERAPDMPGAGGEAERLSHFTALNELARRMSFHESSRAAEPEDLLDFIRDPGRQPNDAREDTRVLALGIMQLYPGFDLGDFVSRTPQPTAFTRSLEHDFGTLCVLREAHRHVVEGFNEVEDSFWECHCLYDQYRLEGQADAEVDQALRSALMAFADEEPIEEPDHEAFAIGA